MRSTVAEEEQRRHQRRRGDDAGELRPAAGGEVDRSARIRGGDREGAEEARRRGWRRRSRSARGRCRPRSPRWAPKLRAVTMPALKLTAKIAQAPSRTLSSGSPPGDGMAKRRQPGGDVADDRDAVAAEVEGGREQRPPAPRRRAAPAPGSAPAVTPCSTASIASASATEGQWMLPALLRQLDERRDQAVRLDRDAGEAADLADEDRERDADEEAGQDRPRQEAREHAEPQRPRQQAERADGQRQHRRHRRRGRRRRPSPPPPVPARRRARSSSRRRVRRSASATVRTARRRPGARCWRRCRSPAAARRSPDRRWRSAGRPRRWRGRPGCRRAAIPPGSRGARGQASGGTGRARSVASEHQGLHRQQQRLHPQDHRMHQPDGVDDVQEQPARRCRCSGPASASWLLV